MGREKWDEFLKSYFEKYKFKTMVTEVFLQELAGVLLKANGIALVSRSGFTVLAYR